jgi:hypothetical protein
VKRKKHHGYGNISGSLITRVNEKFYAFFVIHLLSTGQVKVLECWRGTLRGHIINSTGSPSNRVKRRDPK